MRPLCCPGCHTPTVAPPGVADEGHGLDVTDGHGGHVDLPTRRRTHRLGARPDHGSGSAESSPRATAATSAAWSRSF